MFGHLPTLVWASRGFNVPEKEARVIMHWLLLLLFKILVF